MAYDSLNQAKKIGVSSAGRVYRDRIGDRNDRFYQFQLSGRSYLTVTLRNLSKNVDLYLLDSGGTILQQSAFPGRSSEVIINPAASEGTFFLRAVARQSSTDYRLEVAAVPLSRFGVVPTPPPQPTRLVANINATRTSNSNPSDFVRINRTLYFAADDGIRGRELWQTNGTQQGTRLVANINPGARSSNPGQLTVVNNVLYFTADNGFSGRELYRLNSTTRAAELVRNINIRANTGSDPTDLINVNGVLYFSANDGIRGRELWRSDGTANGTTLVRDINGGTGSSISDQFGGGSSFDRSRFVNINNTLYFAANDGTFGTELWRSDGTNAGTQLVRNININRTDGSDPTNLVSVNNTLYFAANDGTFGTELWRSDGTAAGTQLVSNINTNPTTGSNPSDLINVNGRLFFSANSSTNGRELYQLNGTQLTRIDINLGRNSSISEPSQGLQSPVRSRFINIRNTLYFAATNSISTGVELWRSNGTQAGTSLVRDINPGRPSSNIQELTNIRNTLYFSADGGAFGQELWRSNGTREGTVRVSDINSGRNGSNPAEFVLLGSNLIFSASTASFGRELWRLPSNTRSLSERRKM
jgi:ELWxxDGT repeat protein